MNDNKKNINLEIKPSQISKIGLGCMGMSCFYGSHNDEESIKVIIEAFNRGITHFDTSDSYGNGANEELLGRAIKSLDRSRIVVATKCGYVFDKSNNTIASINGTARHIKESCEKSLKRLGVENIDIFYLHRVDPNIPIEESMEALSGLVKEGKILKIGLSEVDSSIILRANTIHQLYAIQSEYSILHRYAEKEIIPLCKSLKINFIASSPICNGFLAGKIKTPQQFESNDLRREMPRFQDKNFNYNYFFVNVLKSIAQQKGCTPGQLALAWVLAQGDHIMAIPGTKHINYLEENIKALDINLSSKELSELDSKIPVGANKGTRFTKELAKLLNTYQ
ncbi:MAG: aldo/keto reductase [Neisseriaceae bacterium]